MKGYDPNRSPTSQEGRDQVKMFVADLKSREGEDWFRSWPEIDWDELKRWVAANVLNPQRRMGLFHVIQRWSPVAVAPSRVPGLEYQILDAWRESLSSGSVVALASMRPKRDVDMESWVTVDKDVLIWPYGRDEGGIGKILGTMGSGKTNTAMVIAQRWLDKWPTHEVVTNIPIRERRIQEPGAYEGRIVYANQLSRVLAFAVGFAEQRHSWLWLFDELAGAGWLRDSASSNVAKDLAVLIRYLRKMDGNLIVIEQRARGIPSILAEFSESESGATYHCYKPRGILEATIKTAGHERPWHKRAKDFPKAHVAFETWDVTAMSIDFRVPDLLAAMAAAGPGRRSQLSAMRRFLEKLDMPVPIASPPDTPEVPASMSIADMMSRLADGESPRSIALATERLVPAGPSDEPDDPEENEEGD